MSTATEKSSAKQLNHYLQGIHMGIDTFITLKEKGQTPTQLEQCEKILMLYEQHKLEISHHIEELNNKAREEFTLLGKLSNFFVNRKLNKLNSQQEITLTMQDSFSTGITMVEKFLAQNSQTIPNHPHQAIIDFLDKNIALEKEFHWKK